MVKAGNSRNLYPHLRVSADCTGPIHPLVRDNFDAVYYMSEYPDLKDLDTVGALEHFWKVGWLEGRNPNSWFDTSSYLEMNQDVYDSGVNPLLHYLGWGKSEGRAFRRPLSLREINQELFKDPRANWLKPVGRALDKDFYRAQFTGEIPEALNLTAHYVFRGWKEDLFPNAQYPDETLPEVPRQFAHFVPPLVFKLLSTDQQTKETLPEPEIVVAIKRRPVGSEIGTVARRQLVELDFLQISNDIESMHAISDQIQQSTALREYSKYADDQINEISANFDNAYYFWANPDVKDAGVDPIEHYYYTGWREGRDPTPWFSTTYYLNTNSDIAAAQVNPFWHYLVAGKHEGRLAKPQGRAKREQLECLRAPEERTLGHITPDHFRIGPEELRKLLSKAVANRTGLVWASSHDCYTQVTGGTQIFIADEQRLFNARDVTYIHASPLNAALVILDTPCEQTLTRIVIDGEIVGVLTDAEIIEVLSSMKGIFPSNRIFVVHSVLGHSVRGLVGTHQAIQPNQSFFWIHDYSSVCSGFTLLRNDIEFCHAPQPNSRACGICIYGQSRPTHLKHVRTLFEACDFIVAAPSDIARSIWRGAVTLPHRGSITVPHCTIEKKKIIPDGRPPELLGTTDHPVRVAYVGYPTPLKGWPLFEQIVERTRVTGGYEFFHFATPGSFKHSDRIRSVEARVTPDERDAMSKLILAQKIDFVVIGAPWPETFSYVLFEALAAGSEVVTVKDSGNVAATVERTGRGFVFETEEELIHFFENHLAVAYVRARSIHGIESGKLAHNGTTAAVYSGSNAGVRYL